MKIPTIAQCLLGDEELLPPIPSLQHFPETQRKSRSLCLALLRQKANPTFSVNCRFSIERGKMEKGKDNSDSFEGWRTEIWILCHAHGWSLQQILKINPNFQAVALPREHFLSLSPVLVLIPFPSFPQFGSLKHELLWVAKGQTQACYFHGLFPLVLGCWVQTCTDPAPDGREKPQNIHRQETQGDFHCISSSFMTLAVSSFPASPLHTMRSSAV